MQKVFNSTTTQNKHTIALTTKHAAGTPSYLLRLRRRGELESLRLRLRGEWDLRRGEKDLQVDDEVRNNDGRC